MRPPLRIAILECDTPLEGTKASYGSYGGVFVAMLKAGADTLNVPGLSSHEGLDISTYDVEHKELYPNLDDIDAILITGARSNAFDNTPWILKLVDFVKKVLAQDRVRTIGVCFGHQIIGRAMGVKVDRNDAGWETSVIDIDLLPKGKEIFKQDTLSLHQMHRDIVYTYPEGVQALAETSKCKVQAMYVPRKMIAVQGHPEFTPAIMNELLEARLKMGIFGQDMYEDSTARAGKPHDGIVVSAAFLRFLLEE